MSSGDESNFKTESSAPTGDGSEKVVKEEESSGTDSAKPQRKSERTRKLSRKAAESGSGTEDSAPSKVRKKSPRTASKADKKVQVDAPSVSSEESENDVREAEDVLEDQSDAGSDSDSGSMRETVRVSRSKSKKRVVPVSSSSRFCPYFDAPSRDLLESFRSKTDLKAGYLKFAEKVETEAVRNATDRPLTATCKDRLENLLSHVSDGVCFEWRPSDMLRVIHRALGTDKNLRIDQFKRHREANGQSRSCDDGYQFAAFLALHLWPTLFVSTSKASVNLFDRIKVGESARDAWIRLLTLWRETQLEAGFAAYVWLTALSDVNRKVVLERVGGLLTDKERLVEAISRFVGVENTSACPEAFRRVREEPHSGFNPRPAHSQSQRHPNNSNNNNNNSNNSSNNNNSNYSNNNRNNRRQENEGSSDRPSFPDRRPPSGSAVTSTPSRHASANVVSAPTQEQRMRELAVTTVHVGNSSVCTLLDTGAEVSLVNRSTVNRLGLETMRAPVPVSISGFGSGAATATEVAVIKFSLLGRSFRLIPMIVPDNSLQHGFLISYPDMGAMNLALAMASRRIFFEDQIAEFESVSSVGVVASSDSTLPPGTSTPVQASSTVSLPGDVGMAVSVPNQSHHLHTSGPPLFVESEMVTIGETFTINVVNTGSKEMRIKTGTPLATLDHFVPFSTSATPASVFVTSQSDVPVSVKPTRIDLVEKDFLFQEDVAKIEDREDLSPGFRASLAALILKFSTDPCRVLVVDLTMGGRARVQPHRIVTINGSSFKSLFFNYPPYKQAIINRQVNAMLERGIISRSSATAVSSPILVAKANPMEEPRMCINYVPLNNITQPDPFPIPRVSTLVASMRGSVIISVFDMCSGFYQIPMDHDSKAHTAFATATGVYEFNVMPFGLKNAPSTFQRAMSDILREFLGEFVQVYFDDIAVFSSSETEHLNHLAVVLTRLGEFGIEVKMSKCKWAVKEVRYLGKLVSGSGVRPDPAKIAPILECSTPRNSTEVRVFVGKVVYYQDHMPELALVANPLFELMSPKTEFRWSTDCNKAFLRLKEILASESFLVHPDFESDRPFIVYSDASGLGAGAVLSQLPENAVFSVKSKYPAVSNFSRVFNKAERGYDATQREALGVVWSVEHWEWYLGKKFIIITDNSAMRWLLPKIDKAPAHILRWGIRLMPFAFDVYHRPGVSHQNADALSRPPFIKDALAPLQVNLLQSQALLMQAVVPFRLPSTQDIVDAQQVDSVCIAVSGGVVELNKAESRALRAMKKLAQLGADGVLRITRGDMSLIYTPKSLRTRIFNYFHVNATAGHLSMAKTQARIAETFVWFGMNTDIQDLIESCIACGTSKHNRSSPSLGHLQSIVVTRPWQILGMDLAVSLPRTSSGFIHALFVIDYFTKWLEVIPLKDMTSATVCSALLQVVIMRYGIPESIITDAGTNVTSSAAQDMYQFFGIDKRRSTPHHQQTDGACERVIGTLKQMLTAYVAHKREDWVTFLPFVVYAYNTARHSATKYSPFELVFGRKPTAVEDLVYESKIPSYDTSSIQQYADSLSRYHVKMTDEMLIAKFIVNSHLEKASELNSTSYNLKRANVQFAVGDWVYLASQSEGALEALRVGPLLVVGVKNRLVYQVAHPLRRDEPYTCSIANLQPAKAPREGEWESIKGPPKSNPLRYVPDKAVDSLEASMFWEALRVSIGELHTEMFLAEDEEKTNPNLIRDRVHNLFSSSLLIMDPSIRKKFLDTLQEKNSTLLKEAEKWHKNFDATFGPYKVV